MTTLQEAATATTFATRLVDRVARGLGRFSRRGFLVQTAVVGSALAVDLKGYVLTPQTAASTVCGPASSCSEGYTVMCCTINQGVNGCPPGTFAAGWWKAADSSWCGGGYRYIVDCNASCSKCTSGCSGDNICSSGCWSCGCKCGSSASCDQRRVCCNAFRYGQCNTHVRCSGGVACRVVSCIAPYTWANCTTTSLTDNATAEHSAPCLPKWDAITAKYVALGGEGSPLGVSTGPERIVGDGRGKYVTFQHGSIYWSSATAAHAVLAFVGRVWAANGGASGALGYPTTDQVHAPGKWIQFFERGAIADTDHSVTSTVSGYAYTVWRRQGGEQGVLGYPVRDREFRPDRWIQYFEDGVIADTTQSTTSVVFGSAYRIWRSRGGEGGILGFPFSDRLHEPGKWVQYFEKGALADTSVTSTATVFGYAFTLWRRGGGHTGPLGYPVADRVSGADRWIQHFEHGAIADTTSSVTSIVHGAVYQRWMADGGEAGRWGYPVGPASDNPDGTSSQPFEGGVLTA